MSQIPPIVVPIFNNGQYIEFFVEQCFKVKLDHVIIVDNASTGIETQKILENIKHKTEVIFLKKNYGPRYALHANEFTEKMPDKFFLSDPDLVFNRNLPENFYEIMANLSEKFKIGKVGMALNISSLKLDSEKKYFSDGRLYDIKEWESQYWSEQIDLTIDGSPIYKAAVDTTFCLVNLNYFEPNDELLGLRIGKNFECIHIPWMKNESDKSLNEYSEENLYSTWTQKSFISTPEAFRFEMVRKNLEKSLEEIRKENAIREIEQLYNYIEKLHNSKSWKLTEPLRKARLITRKLRRKKK